MSHGGLRLPTPVVGVGATEEKGLHTEWSCYEQAIRYLEMHVGVPPPVEPAYACPPLNLGSLTSTDSKQYIEEFAKKTAWIGYYGQVLSRHKAHLLDLEAEMRAIGVRMRSDLRKVSTRTTQSGQPKAPPAGEMEDAILSSPRHKELEKSALLEKEIIMILEGALNAKTTERDLTSRVVEIRRQDYDGTNRLANTNGNRGLPVSGGEPQYPRGPRR